jgi:TPR repeat protein
MRGLWLLFAIGCGSAVTVDTAERPTIIEASQGVSEQHRDVEPIGEGNAEAQRCFTAAATHGPVEAPCGARSSAACAKRCSEGEVGACHQLGENLAPKDEACAKEMWALACERDHLLACSALGAHALAKGDVNAATKLLRRACDGKVPQACTHLGRALAVDETLDDDAIIASTFERACDLGDGEGCGLAAEHHREGRGVPRDAPQARQLAKRGCELGYLKGCVDLAKVLFYAQVPDKVEARRLVEQVCRVDGDPSAADACFQLALFIGAGKRVKELYKRACDKDHFDACAQVARELYATGHYAEAIRLATKMVPRGPNNALLRYARGMSRLNSGKFDGAVEDLEVLCASWTDAPHCALWLFSARGRAGKPDRTGRLQTAMSDIDQSTWPTPIYRFFLGKIDARRLLKLAEHQDKHRQQVRQCEAHFYVGQQLMMARRDKKAEAHFRKAMATGMSDEVEFAGSRAELTRMGLAP